MRILIVVNMRDNEPCVIPIDNIACIQRVTDPESGETLTRIYLRHVAGIRPGIFYFVLTHESPSDLAARIEGL